MSITRNTMKAWAIELRVRTSLAIPVDLDAVTGVLDINIIESDDLPDNILGMHIKHSEDDIVAIQRKLSYGCRRFTIAHEICHHLIDRAMPKNRTSIPADRIEKLCNTFAAELLMPAADVQLHAKRYNYGLTENYLKQLSDYFEVTPNAMSIRLKELRIPEWWWETADQGELLYISEGRRSSKVNVKR